MNSTKKNKIWKFNTIDRIKQKLLQDNLLLTELISSILIQRGFDTIDKAKNFIKPSLYNMSSPYLFRDMEKSVERIYQNINSGKGILIFGDKDVDGVTATSILYKTLQKLNAKVVYRVPEGTENYGISKDVVDWALSQNLDLLISVDCGITAIEEIEFAQKMGIDVIVTDHHEPRDKLPQSFAIINPKVTNNGYSFPYLSGASVAFKLASAILEKDALKDYYNQDICFLDLETSGLNPTRDEILEIGVIKYRNGVNIGVFQALLKAEKPIPQNITNLTGITQEMIDQGGLPVEGVLRKFLDFIGNNKLVGHNLVEFDFKFLEHTLKKVLGIAIQNPMEDTLRMSRIMLKKSKDHKLGTIAEYLGIYVDKTELHRSVKDSEVCAEVYRRLILSRNNRIMELYNELLPFAAVGTIADIMPLIDENRTIVKNGLKLLPQSSIGLISLIRASKLNLDRIHARDISWSIAPQLNSPGRVGDASISVELLVSSKIKDAENLIQRISSKDQERRDVMDNGWEVALNMITPTMLEEDRFIIIQSNQFRKGTTGLLANKLSSQFWVPAVVIAIEGEYATGSIRSPIPIDVVKLLEYASELFTQFGGHKAAGGFTIKTEVIGQLHGKALEYLKNSDFQNIEEEIFVEAKVDQLSEISLNTIRYMESALEPYGNYNEPPKLLFSQVKISQKRNIGKNNAHILFTIQKNNETINVIGWNWAKSIQALVEGNDLQKTFFDLIASPEINKYMQIEEARLNLIDIAMHPYPILNVNVRKENV